MPASQSMTTPEAAARQSIDAALEEAGWIVQDARAANLQAGRGVAIREDPLLGGHGRLPALRGWPGRWRRRGQGGRLNPDRRGAPDRQVQPGSAATRPSSGPPAALPL